MSRAIDVVLSAGFSTTSATPAILVMTKVLKTCYTSHYRVTITFSVNIGVNPRGAQRSQFIPRRPEVLGRRTSSQPTHTSRRMVSYSDGTVDRSTIGPPRPTPLPRNHRCEHRRVPPCEELGAHRNRGAPRCSAKTTYLKYGKVRYRDPHVAKV